MGELLTIGTLLLRLVLFLMESARERTEQGVGYMRAVKDALEQAHRDIAEADAERLAAEAEHRKHPNDDGGFLDEFRRD